MPAAFNLLSENGLYISLIKPQFEAGKSNVGKGGIVKDKSARLLAVSKVIDSAFANGFVCNSLIKSPIQGGDGNTEYLGVFSKFGEKINENEIKKLINS